MLPSSCIESQARKNHGSRDKEATTSKGQARFELESGHIRYAVAVLGGTDVECKFQIAEEPLNTSRIEPNRAVAKPVYGLKVLR